MRNLVLGPRMSAVVNKYSECRYVHFKNTTETLPAYLEVNLSHIEISDREDQRELAQLDNASAN